MKVHSKCQRWRTERKHLQCIPLESLVKRETRPSVWGLKMSISPFNSQTKPCKPLSSQMAKNYLRVNWTKNWTSPARSISQNPPQVKNIETIWALSRNIMGAARGRSLETRWRRIRVRELAILSEGSKGETRKHQRTLRLLPPSRNLHLTRNIHKIRWLLCSLEVSPNPWAYKLETNRWK